MLNTETRSVQGFIEADRQRWRESGRQMRAQTELTGVIGI